MCIGQAGIDPAQFGGELTESSFRFYDSLQHNAEARQFELGQFCTIGYVSFFLLCVFIGSIIALKIENENYMKIQSIKKFASEDEANESNDFIMEVPSQRKSCANRFFLCFNFQENIYKLFYARSKDGDKNLEILNGIRVLSMFWIIVGHTYYYFTRGPLQNPLVIRDLFTDLWFTPLAGAPYSVDIFFWLTGFLGAYIMLRTMHKRNGKLGNPLLIYLHRYLRIIPLYTAAMLFYWFIMPVAGDGPVFFILKERASDCGTYWWSHFLFINNLYPWDKGELCMGWTWYLGNDFQFFLLIPLLVYLYYHKRKVCMVLVSIILSLSFIITMVLTNIHDLPISYLQINNDYNIYYYWKPWCRIGPFIIGLFCAFFLYSYNFENEGESAVKRLMNGIDESKGTRWIMYILGAIIWWGLLIAGQVINKDPDHYSMFFNMLFLAFSRTLFVLSMSLMIMPLLMGHATYARKLLSLDIFVPIARLTFGAYIVHPSYMLFEAINSPRGKWLNINTGIFYFLAWLLVAFTTSLIFTVLIESP